jgi:hypothetical protein
VVGEYEDGVPLVVVLDGEANRTKARQEEEKARREEAAAAEQEQGSDRSQAESDDNSGDGGDDMCEPQPAKPAKPDQEAEEEWGKTVFLNFFPVSKDDPCTGTPLNTLEPCVSCVLITDRFGSCRWVVRLELGHSAAAAECRSVRRSQGSASSSRTTRPLLSPLIGGRGSFPLLLSICPYPNAPSCTRKGVLLLRDR